MIKDRLFKQALLEYYTKRFWYPQLEVNILSKHRLSSTKKLITDVDVLGLYNDATGYFKFVLGDCKTLKGQSPVSRVLWMKGLMEYLNASKGIIILTKNIEKEHQLTASTLDIQLLSDKDFSVFSRNTANYVTSPQSALSVIDNWDKYLDIGKRFLGLNPFVEYSHTHFWNEQSSNYQLRSGVYILKHRRGEINPENILHQSIVLNHFSLVSLALNNILIQIFSQYLVPYGKGDLEEDLKVIIYGGIENYEFLNDLRKRFGGTAAQTEDLKLPEWNKLIELVRLLLDNPLSFADVSLFLKELSFLLLSDPTQNYGYAKGIVSKNKYVTMFSIRLIEYLCAATNLPSDLRSILEGQVLEFEKQ